MIENHEPSTTAFTRLRLTSPDAAPPVVVVQVQRMDDASAMISDTPFTFSVPANGANGLAFYIYDASSPTGKNMELERGSVTRSGTGFIVVLPHTSASSGHPIRTPTPSLTPIPSPTLSRDNSILKTCYNCPRTVKNVGTPNCRDVTLLVTTQTFPQNIELTVQGATKDYLCPDVHLPAASVWQENTEPRVLPRLVTRFRAVPALGGGGDCRACPRPGHAIG